MTIIAKLSVIALIAFVFPSACNQATMKDTTQEEIDTTNPVKVSNGQRYGMITGIKPEKIAYYKKLHAAVWPAVLKTLTDCNIRNYSIYLKELAGKSYLFSYFEYTGTDFKSDMAKMAADTATQRWWKETAPTQFPLPDAIVKGETWSPMEEVFHTD